MLQCFSSAENLRHHIMHNASMVSVVSVPQVGGVIDTRYEHMFFIYNTTNNLQLRQAAEKVIEITEAPRQSRALV